MEQEHPRTFGPFHVDGPQGRLWQGVSRTPLAFIAMSMICCLTPAE